MDVELEKDLEGVGRGLIDVLSQNLLGWTEEHHENPCRISDIPTDIRTGRLPNTSLVLYTIQPPKHHVYRSFFKSKCVKN
jgi:hypothetical protein